MEYNIFYSFCTFVFISSITPGPNNLMLATSSLNFGFYRTIPQILGIIFGFFIIITLCFFGIEIISIIYPKLLLILTFFSVIFLTYIIYRILIFEFKNSNTTSKPFSFLEGLSFQLINPKGIFVIISSITTFSDITNNNILNYILLTTVFLISTFISTCIWSLFGKIISIYFTNEKYFKLFKYSMASTMFICLIIILIYKKNQLILI